MTTFKIEKACDGDNLELQALCSIPSDGFIRLSFTKHPDFFAAVKLHGEESETYVCREIITRQLAGIFSVSKRQSSYNNTVHPILYFSDLRINPKNQGSKVLYLIVRFITDNIMEDTSIGQTIVFADNIKMLELINSLHYRSNRLSILRFHPHGMYKSYMVKFQQCNTYNGVNNIRKANEGDILQMETFVSLQKHNKNLFTGINFFSLGKDSYLKLHIDNYYLAFKNDTLVGIAAIWDQNSIRQTKILSYSKIVNQFRQVINFIGRFGNNFQLPKAGTIINFLNVHSIVIKDNDPVIFQGLLHHISSEYYKSTFDYFLVGFDANDPLNNALKSFKTKRIILGKHFLITKDNRNVPYNADKLFYLESARI